MAMIQGEVSIPLSGVRMETNRKAFVINLKAVNLCLLSLLAASFCLYLFSVVTLTSRGGIDLRDLKVQVSDLANQNNQLEARVNSLKAYGQLKTKVESLGMEAAGDLQYLYKHQAVAKQ